MHVTIFVIGAATVQLSPACNITVAETSNDNVTCTCDLLTADPNVGINWQINKRQIPEIEYQMYADHGVHIKDEGRNVSRVVITAKGRQNLSPNRPDQNQRSRAIPILCYSYNTTTSLGGIIEESTPNYIIMFGM